MVYLQGMEAEYGKHFKTVFNLINPNFEKISPKILNFH